MDYYERRAQAARAITKLLNEGGKEHEIIGIVGVNFGLTKKAIVALIEQVKLIPRIEPAKVSKEQAEQEAEAVLGGFSE